MTLTKEQKESEKKIAKKNEEKKKRKLEPQVWGLIFDLVKKSLLI